MRHKYALGNVRGNGQGNVPQNQPQLENPEGKPESAHAMEPTDREHSNTDEAMVPRQELIKVVDERRRLKERLRTLEEKLDETNRKQQEVRLRELAETKDFDQLKNEMTASLKQVQQKASQWENRYKSEKIYNAVLEEAARQRAYNPAQIAKLIKGDISLDESMNPIFNDGRTLSEGMRDFFSQKENHNLLKASENITGAGSFPGGVLSGSHQNTLEEARIKAQKTGLPHDIVAYQRLKRKYDSA